MARKKDSAWKPPEVKLDAVSMSYNELEWFVPASNDKGQSERLGHIRIPPEMDREIERIIRSGKFPYVTQSDFVRHALLRHVCFCHCCEPDMPRHVLSAMQSMSTLMADAHMRHKTEDTCQQLVETCQLHVQRGMLDEAVALARQCMAFLNDCGKSQRSEELKTRLRKTLKELLDQRSHIKLSASMTAPESLPTPPPETEE